MQPKLKDHWDNGWEHFARFFGIHSYTIRFVCCFCKKAMVGWRTAASMVPKKNVISNVQRIQTSCWLTTVRTGPSEDYFKACLHKWTCLEVLRRVRHWYMMLRVRRCWILQVEQHTFYILNLMHVLFKVLVTLQASDSGAKRFLPSVLWVTWRSPPKLQSQLHLSRIKVKVRQQSDALS